MLDSRFWESGTFCFVLFFSVLCLVSKNNLRFFAQICSDYQLMYLCIAIQSKRVWDCGAFELHSKNGCTSAKPKASFRFAFGLRVLWHIDTTYTSIRFCFLSFSEFLWDEGWLPRKLTSTRVSNVFVNNGRSADCQNLPCCDSTAVFLLHLRTHTYVCVHYLQFTGYETGNTK